MPAGCGILLVAALGEIKATSRIPEWFFFPRPGPFWALGERSLSSEAAVTLRQPIVHANH
jgi:hypothetical protein